MSNTFFQDIYSKKAIQVTVSKYTDDIIKVIKVNLAQLYLKLKILVYVACRSPHSFFCDSIFVFMEKLETRQIF